MLFKVGYDVFDRVVAKEIGKLLLKQKTLLDKKDVPLIVLTILVTLFVNLSVAAIGATILFYIIQKITDNSLPDLHELLADEDN